MPATMPTGGIDGAQRRMRPSWSRTERRRSHGRGAARGEAERRRAQAQGRSVASAARRCSTVASALTTSVGRSSRRRPRSPTAPVERKRWPGDPRRRSGEHRCERRGGRGATPRRLHGEREEREQPERREQRPGEEASPVAASRQQPRASASARTPYMSAAACATFPSGKSGAASAIARPAAASGARDPGERTRATTPAARTAGAAADSGRDRGEPRGGAGARAGAGAADCAGAAGAAGRGPPRGAGSRRGEGRRGAPAASRAADGRSRGVHGERRVDGGEQPAGQVGRRAESGGAPEVDRRRDLRERDAPERVAPGERLPEDHADGPDVAPLGGLLAREPLGRDVRERPGHVADGGQRVGLVELGEPEVEEADRQLLALLDEHVRGLHVPVHDPAPVGVGEAVEHLGGDLDRLGVARGRRCGGSRGACGPGRTRTRCRRGPRPRRSRRRERSARDAGARRPPSPRSRARRACPRAGRSSARPRGRSARRATARRSRSRPGRAASGAGSGRGRGSRSGRAKAVFDTVWPPSPRAENVLRSRFSRTLGRVRVVRRPPRSGGDDPGGTTRDLSRRRHPRFRLRRRRDPRARAAELQPDPRQPGDDEVQPGGRGPRRPHFGGAARPDPAPPPRGARRVRDPRHRPARGLGAGLRRATTSRPRTAHYLGRDRRRRQGLRDDRRRPRDAAHDPGARAGRAGDAPRRPACSSRSSTSRARRTSIRRDRSTPAQAYAVAGAAAARRRAPGHARHVPRDEGHQDATAAGRQLAARASASRRATSSGRTSSRAPPTRRWRPRASRASPRRPSVFVTNSDLYTAALDELDLAARPRRLDGRHAGRASTAASSRTRRCSRPAIQLTTSTETKITISTDLAFEVGVNNSGENQEVGVKVQADHPRAADRRS